MKGLSISKRLDIASHALRQVGEKYSWYLISVLAVLKLLRLEWLINGVRRKGEICSVVVAKAYKGSIGYNFNSSECVDFIDPMDIASKILITDKAKWQKIK